MQTFLKYRPISIQCKATVNLPSKISVKSTIGSVNSKLSLKTIIRGLFHQFNKVHTIREIKITVKIVKVNQVHRTKLV